MTDPTAKGGDSAETPRPPQAESRENKDDLALDLAEEWTSPETTAL